jgi:hypothetical protein
MTRFARSSLYLSVIAILVLLSQSITVAQTSRPAVNAEVVAFAVAYRTNGESALSSLTAEQKQQWAARIKSEFATSQIRTDQLAPLAACLAALGDTSVGDLVQSCINAGGGLTTITSSDVQSLVTALDADATAGGKAASVALAGAVESKLLSDDAAMKQAGMKFWEHYVSRAGGSLSAEGKQNWSAKLWQGFMPKSLAADNVIALQRMTNILNNLGDKRMAGELVTLMTTSQDWQTWKPQYVSWLAGSIRSADGAPALAAKTAVAGHFKTKFLTDAAATKSVPLDIWSQWFNGIATVLSAEDKQLLAARVEEAYSKGITQATDKEAMDYVHLMETCNGEYAQATQRVVNASDAWKSREPRHVADMVLLLRPDNSADSKSALTKLAEHVAGPMCNSDTTMRQVTLSQWAKVLKVVSPAIVENKADIATKLSAAFAPNHDAIIKLSSADVTDLADAIASVDPSKVQPLITDYLSSEGNLAKLTPADSVRLVTIASSTCEKAWSEALLGQLGTQWASQQEQSPLKWSDSRAIALVYLTAGQQQKAQEWATNAYQAGVGSDDARTAATLGTLDDIADVFVQAGLTGKGKGYPAFAQAIVSLIHKNVPVNIWIAERYSYMLGTPEALQIVGNEFVDAKGNPNLVAARVITWGHANQQDLPAWRKLLQEKYQASSATGDQKAIWLMIQAHALAVPESTGVMYSPLAGKDCLEEALSSAQSQSVKLMVIEDLVDGYIEERCFDAAVKAANDLKDSLTSAEMVVKFGTMKKKIQQAKVDQANVQQAKMDTQDELYKAELTRRLEDAVKRGDAESVDRYKKLLGIQN